MPGERRGGRGGRAGPLTEKQLRFVEEYLIDLNGAAAYRRAGYRASSDGAAAANAARLITNDNVARAIADARQRQQQRTQIKADDVIAGLHKEATREGDGASHSARVTAWTQIGKHLGMFVDRVKHEGGPVIQTIIGVSAADILGTDTASPPAE